MSFWPLATSLVDALRDVARSGPLIELGVGDGAFAARLAELGIEVLGIDRRVEASACDIAADLRRLPLRRGSIGGFVAANTLRHLSAKDLLQLAHETASCARAKASFTVLEDDPVAVDPANANYHECLRLLARSDPARGELLDRSPCEAALRPAWPRLLAAGKLRNVESVQDARLPLAWLQEHLPNVAELRQRLASLNERVATEGMSYGNYWYLVLQCA
jgi:hypothetical protein